MTDGNFASTSQTVCPTLNQGGRGGRCEVAGVVLVCDVVCVHCVCFHLRNCFRLLSEKVTSSVLPVSAFHRVAMPGACLVARETQRRLPQSTRRKGARSVLACVYDVACSCVCRFLRLSACERPLPSHAPFAMNRQHHASMFEMRRMTQQRYLG